MKAIVCNEYAPVDQLSLETVADPVPAEGDVLVDVICAGINFPDLLIVQGKYQVQPPLPFTPGNEVAGVVAAVGEGVTAVQVGDEVIAYVPSGAFAEKLLVKATSVF